MRYQILKKHSTKSERIIYEILKELQIPFRHRWMVEDMEVDFLVGRIVIEVNGHDQDSERNNKFIQLGYVPIHIQNQDIINNRDSIKQLILYELNETKLT